MDNERLHKALARAGVASRRACEELIAEGRVRVNGEVVREMGVRVDLARDQIVVDDQPVEPPPERVYIMLHKPVGVVSTADDPQGRPTVLDLVESDTRVFPIGRLDTNSEGLLLLTNDGELTHQLTHPRFEIEKEYRALLNSTPTDETIHRWRRGVMLNGQTTAPARVDILERDQQGTWVRIILHEGRKRQIREVAHLLGHRVQRLVRVREGSLVLGDLPNGQWRLLTDNEIRTLHAHASGERAAPPERRGRPVPDRAWREREEARKRQRQERYNPHKSRSSSRPHQRTRPQQRPYRSRAVNDDRPPDLSDPSE